MMFPLESVTSSSEIVLFMAVVIGFGFGFVLEKAGFGVSTKLAAQFYGTDMTVFKVMFTAIVVAALGLVLLGGVGLVDVEGVAASAASYTYIWPMLVGGLLFGVGFVTSGSCPGTSIVAAASGNFDGLMTFGGVIIGSVLFGEAYPLLEGFAKSGNLGHLFLSDVFGVPRAVFVLLVTIMAIGGFIGAERIERIFSEDKRAPRPAAIGGDLRRVRRVVFATLSAIALLSLTSLLTEERAEAETDQTVIPISAQELAHVLTAEPWSRRVLDLRDEDAFTEARVPHSELVPSEGLEVLGLSFSADTRDLVLVSAEGLDGVPVEVQGYSGRVLVLERGFARWRHFTVDTPEPPEPMDQASLDAYTFRSLLGAFLTGQAAAPPPPRPAAAARPRPTSGGGGGCD